MKVEVASFLQRETGEATTCVHVTDCTTVDCLLQSTDDSMNEQNTQRTKDAKLADCITYNSFSASYYQLSSLARWSDNGLICCGFYELLRWWTIARFYRYLALCSIGSSRSERRRVRAPPRRPTDGLTPLCCVILAVAI